jgi:hypothetical protein
MARQETWFQAEARLPGESAMLAASRFRHVRRAQVQLLFPRLNFIHLS